MKFITKVPLELDVGYDLVYYKNKDGLLHPYFFSMIPVL